MSQTTLITLPALILLLPLAAAVVLIFVGRRLPRQGDWLAIGTMALSLVLSLILFARIVVGEHDPETYHRWAFTWMRVGGIDLTMGFLLDNMGVIMTVVVTGLSTVVFVYSIFYMHGDPDCHRYYAKFCFFCFAMLGVVLSENLLMTFVFWELVGLGSYFLIGFWYAKDAVVDVSGLPLSPAFAQKKAFVVNRIGDFGFLSGMALLFAVMIGGGVSDSPLSFSQLFHARHLLASSTGPFTVELHLFGLTLSGTGLLTLATILVFMGAIGKSAQFPLHIWLPDAMQGPTTASSIIHAATMVAAGVFMTARIHPLLTDGSMIFIGYVGAITAFLAATMAIVQWDIKAVLAYSTISQLGYMMLGLGVGGLAAGAGYTWGLAHLYTHAFFKCMLFLCAGAVIHACHHEQNMFKMGGLKDKMPWTYSAMLAGTLAIAGVPLFSGFFSKDGILTSALTAALLHHRAAWIPWALGVITAVLTCFYMFRLIFLTFHGKPRDHHIYEHAHDPRPFKVGVLPVAVLAVFTLGIWWSAEVLPIPFFKINELTRVPGLSVRYATPEGTWKREGWLVHLVQRPEVSRFAALESAGLETLVPATAAHRAAAAAHGQGEGGGHAGGHEDDLHRAEHTAHGIMFFLSLAAVALGLILAMKWYYVRTLDASALEDEKGFAAAVKRRLAWLRPVDADALIASSPLMRGLFNSASKLWYLDIAFTGLMVRAWKKINDLCARFDFRAIDQGLVDMSATVTVRASTGTGWFDNNFVDRLVDLTGYVCDVLGRLLRRFQGGRVQGYVFWTVMALVSIILSTMMVWWAGLVLFVLVLLVTFAYVIVAEFS